MVQENNYQLDDDEAEDFVLHNYWMELGGPDPYSANSGNFDNEQYTEE